MKSTLVLLLFGLGLCISPGQAQIATLSPAWVKTWRGLTTVNSAPCNAWDVHVIGDTVYTTGVKTDNAWLRIAPMVLNAYTLSGDTVWEKTWEGYTGTAGTGAAGLVLIGHETDLYLGGMVPFDSMNASLIQKWDLSGNLIWTHHWGDKTTGHHEVNGLAIVDSFLYVSHYSAESGLVTIDAHIKKFNLNELNAGSSWTDALIWDRKYGAAGMQTTTDGHIYADQSGVYICGQSGGPPGIHPYHYGDSYLIKFDPEGDTAWVQHYTGNGTGCDNAFNLKSDGSNIYVLGFTTTHLGPLGFPQALETQVFVQKYTMGGTLLWTELFGGPKTEYARGLQVDDNHIYAAVSTKSYVDSANNGLDNTLLLTIDKSNGDLVSQRIWGGLGIDNANNSIDQDENGSIYLSGYSTTSASGVDSLKQAVILKVNKNTLVSTEEIASGLKPVSLTVYPNPFSSETTLRSDPPFQGGSLTVFNASGQVVRELDHLSGNTVSISRDHLPPGLYFIQLRQKHRIIASGKVVIR